MSWAQPTKGSAHFSPVLMCYPHLKKKTYSSTAFPGKIFSILDIVCKPRPIYHFSSVIRQRVFFFQNNQINRNPSYKMDLDLLDCLGRVKLIL